MIKKNGIRIILILLLLVGFYLLKELVIYPVSKFTELKPGASYKEIIWKFGKENFQVSVPFYDEGACIENRFISVQHYRSIKNCENRYILYVLNFNSLYRLNNLTIFDSWTESPVCLYTDIRGPRFYKEEITNAKEKLGRLALGTKYEKIKKEFGEPDYIKPGENTVVYKVDDKKCYLLGFSESKKLNQLDIYESYEISSDGNVSGERTFLACDIRIK